MSDVVITQWVKQAMDGDQDAFAEIVYTFQDAVYNLCYRMLGDSGEAEDASQEAFLKAYYNLARYDQERAFKTWLLSIASNHCIDRIRKRKMLSISIDEPTPATLALSSDEPLPENVAMSNEHSQQIQALLDELEPEYRVAVVLRYWYDYSYAEIADISRSTESAVKSRLYRARQLLADKLKDSEPSTRKGLSSRLAID